MNELLSIERMHIKTTIAQQRPCPFCKMAGELNEMKLKLLSAPQLV